MTDCLANPHLQLHLDCPVVIDRIKSGEEISPYWAVRGRSSGRLGAAPTVGVTPTSLGEPRWHRHLSWWSGKESIMAIEEPEYTRFTVDGAYEVRRYRPVIVAEVRVTGDMQAATNAGFRLLAGYIFGGNKGRRSIAMTAPVTLSAGEGTRIAMTAPVTLAGQNGDWVVQFSMPRQWSLDTLPVPDDRRVQLRELPERQMAVLTFSGFTSPSRVARKGVELTDWAVQRGLEVEGTPSLARYDPPWTPWFMRRNEVMIPVTG